MGKFPAPEKIQYFIKTNREHIKYRRNLEENAAPSFLAAVAVAVRVVIGPAVVGD